MQFQVPQFIEVEDKIFGPFTFKQFIYMIGAAGIAFMAWKTTPIYVAVPIAALALGLGGALAFFKYNSRPFILAMETGFFYLISNKLFLWDAEGKMKNKKDNKNEIKNAQEIKIPKLSDSKLHELSWSLDIREKIEDSDFKDVPQSAQTKVAPVSTSRDARV
jgi:hypothetical protein